PVMTLGRQSRCTANKPRYRVRQKEKVRGLIAAWAVDLLWLESSAQKFDHQRGGSLTCPSAILSRSCSVILRGLRPSRRVSVGSEFAKCPLLVAWNMDRVKRATSSGTPLFIASPTLASSST